MWEHRSTNVEFEGKEFAFTHHSRGRHFEYVSLVTSREVSVFDQFIYFYFSGQIEKSKLPLTKLFYKVITLLHFILFLFLNVFVIYYYTFPSICFALFFSFNLFLILYTYRFDPSLFILPLLISLPPFSLSFNLNIVLSDLNRFL